MSDRRGRRGSKGEREKFQTYKMKPTEGGGRGSGDAKKGEAMRRHAPSITSAELSLKSWYGTQIELCKVLMDESHAMEKGAFNNGGD